MDVVVAVGARKSRAVDEFITTSGIEKRRLMAPVARAVADPTRLSAYRATLSELAHAGERMPRNKTNESVNAEQYRNSILIRLTALAVFSRRPHGFRKCRP